jgi:hypothetical protein
MRIDRGNLSLNDKINISVHNSGKNNEFKNIDTNDQTGMYSRESRGEIGRKTFTNDKDDDIADFQNLENEVKS